ncbi:MAG: radical SAM family heme chaperone HemW [Desulfohalobiaceae bacterium]|nr:radical SAM family heme chaperone HemW [Desulfohalobiaceae bacterium]
MLLYVHYPFCRSKCAYCGFFSQVRDEELEKAYFSALLREVEHWGRHLDRPRVSTLYIGGGTPSLLTPRDLELLAEQINRHFNLEPGLELTLEANPDSLDSPDLARALAKVGVNRVSLGLQSLDDSQLSLLKRPHTARQGLRAVNAVRSAGIENLGLDLLWGLPNQTPLDWLEQVGRAASLEPEHISCYCLTLEKGTLLQRRAERGELGLPREEQLEAMYMQGAELLGERGYLHYEIANFARPGYFCRHNLGYWRGRDYLGLGPSAVSTLQGRRWANPKDVLRYAETVRTGALGGDAAMLSRGQRLEEFLMLSLRTREGLDLDGYRDLGGEELLQDRAEVIRALRERELIGVSGRRLWLTTRGMLLCDSVTGALMPELE